MAETEYPSAILNDDSNYTSESWLYNFWQKADGFVANKFHIGLSGEYVEKALTVMQINSERDKYSTTQKLFKGSSSIKNRFREWIRTYWNTNTRMLSMFWNCKSVTLPNPKISPTPHEGLDSTKALNYSIAKDVGSSGSVKLNIIDNQYLMWMQFFNALFNCQIDPLVLRPSSTFHKIKLNIEILNGQLAVNQNGTINTTDLDIFQMYEYNSVVLESAPVVSPDNDAMALYGFDIAFSCPNVLNGSFKTTNRNLRDLTSTSKATQILNGELDYNKNFWEWSSSSARKGSATSYDALSAADEENFINKGKKFTLNS